MHKILQSEAFIDIVNSDDSIFSPEGLSLAVLADIIFIKEYGILIFCISLKSGQETSLLPRLAFLRLSPRRVLFCPYHPHDLENFHIFDRGLAKNSFTICNARRQMPHDTTIVNIFLLRATRTKESSDNDIDDGNFKTVNTTSTKKKYSHRFIGA